MIKKFGGKKVGGTVYKTKAGKEVQLGVGSVHLGAGYDRKNKSAGFDVSFPIKGKTKSFGWRFKKK